jgi:UDPglucose 6-dehydrogenase
VQVVSNPEFLREGSAVKDFLEPDRIVIGGESPEAFRIMRRLYDPIVKREEAFMTMNWESAELSKYAANSMLAARISFMNEMTILCEHYGADIEDIRKGIGSDFRIGPHFLRAGCGYGGSCFPKDVKALMVTARDVGLEFDLLRAVEGTNARQKRCLLSKALRHYGDVSSRTFAVWGLAFKPKTDDMREAPSVELIEGLLGKGARVQCHDPVATEVAQRYFGDRVLYAPTCYDAAEGADGLFLVTEWNEFRHPDMKRLKTVMKSPVIFDGRNVFDPQRARDEGFTYFGIGRG